MSGHRSLADGTLRIPVEVMHALEDGRLLFFCGAGISVGTGLPTFHELTSHAYRASNLPMSRGRPVDTAAREAFKRAEYDKVLEIIETRDPNRAAMRRAVADRLTKWKQGSDVGLALHRALIDLSELRMHDGGLRGFRLVTTNFDDRFERAGLCMDLNEDGPRISPPSFAGPAPAVHLHGRIGSHDPRHANLVLTTRDFGNAYLRHGWASRFVIEAFREYSVLFIGYSLSDPVMRYLMDALATERGGDGQFRDAYALAAYDGGKPGNREREAALWEAKRVIPILFDKHAGDKPYSVQTAALVEWAEIRRSGLDGKKRVAVEATEAGYRREDPTDADRLANVLWSLTGPDAEVIARHLAGFDSSPDISWFAPIIEKLARRPDQQPSTIARASGPLHDGVAAALAKWACRHLDQNDLIRLFVVTDFRFFPELTRAVRLALHRLDPAYANIWRLLLLVDEDEKRFNADYIALCEERSVTRADRLRFELRLRLQAEKPFVPEFDPPDTPGSHRHLVWFRLVNAVDNHHSIVAAELHRAIRENSAAETPISAKFLDQMTTMLDRGLQLARMADLNAASGRSHYERQYLVKSPLDEYADGLDVLLDLMMAGFTCAARTDAVAARMIAHRWEVLGRGAEGALFTRLWLWSAADSGAVDADAVARRLIDDPAVLWGDEYQAELLRFLRKGGSQLPSATQARLVSAIERGPTDGEDGRSLDRRLAKLILGGAVLSDGLRERAQALVDEWREAKVSDDFLEIDRPLSQAELARRFGEHEPDPRAYSGRPANDILDAAATIQTDYRRAEFIRMIATDHPDRITELAEAARNRPIDGVWVYRGLFWTLKRLPMEATDAETHMRVIRFFSDRPDIVRSCPTECARWLDELVHRSAFAAQDDNAFWQLWDTLAGCPWSEAEAWSEDRKPIEIAFGSLGGSLANILVFSEPKRERRPGEGVTASRRHRFDQLAMNTTAVGQQARVVLCSYLAWLYYIDPIWTRQHLIDRLAWDSSDRAETARLWQTFAFRPNWTGVIAVLRSPFLEALRHRTELGNLSHDRLCSVFGRVVVNSPRLIPRQPAIGALHAMGAAGACAVFRQFKRECRVVGDAAGALWRTRIGPWLEKHWPAEDSLTTGRPVGAAIELALETREAFPNALAVIESRFVLETVDTNQTIWLFNLHHVDEGDYDYLADHPNETGQLLAAVKDVPDIDLTGGMSAVVARYRKLFPDQSSVVWAPLISRFATS